jgi:hypothetical protein
MKLAPTFDKWITDNAERIAQDSDEFKQLVTNVSMYLKQVDKGHGVAAVIYEPMMADFAKLDTEIAARGMTRPDITIPKIKIIHPGRPR